MESEEMILFPGRCCGGLGPALVPKVIRAVGGLCPLTCYVSGFGQGSVTDEGAPHSLSSTEGCQDIVPSRPECFIFLSLLLLPFNQGLGGNCSVDKQLEA